ncbi:unnamed protein product, partial [Ectocarpus fasciculatus]
GHTKHSSFRQVGAPRHRFPVFHALNIPNPGLLYGQLVESQITRTALITNIRSVHAMPLNQRATFACNMLQGSNQSQNQTNPSRDSVHAVFSLTGAVARPDDWR